MPQTLTLPAPAKLNRFLHITGRRDDGYHELQTLFQMLDWCDDLTFTRKPSGDLEFSCSNADLISEDNLVVRAHQALQVHTGQPLPVHLHLHKRLPMGGGLGGGSSDAATTLLGLNQLFELNISQDLLQDIGRSLGADVPVFVAGQTAWAEGIGEKLTPLALEDAWFVIIHPNVHVSTARLFSHPELTRHTPVSTIRRELAHQGHNDFEPLVRRLYPEIEMAFQSCLPYGNARLTGSGACLFLTMPDQTSAENVQKAIQNQRPEAAIYAVRGLNTSPARLPLSTARS